MLSSKVQSHLHDQLHAKQKYSLPRSWFLNLNRTWVGLMLAVSIPIILALPRDEIARKTEGFSEIVTRLGTAFGRSLTEYSPDTLGYYGTTDIYWDWDPILVTGDPKPFLDSLKVGKCPMAEKQPEIWKTLITRLEIASQDYANQPKRWEEPPSSIEGDEKGASPPPAPAPNLR